MQQKAATQQKKSSQIQKNPLEVLRELGAGAAKQTVSEMGRMGAGMLEQLTGQYSESEQTQVEQNKEQPKKLFDRNEHHEQVTVKEEIKAILEQIHREVESLKRDNKSLLNEVKDVHNLTINEFSEKPGVYHVRFLELILSILRTVREKIGDSNTWLQAMMSKKKKRGSLFAGRSKQMGTQYSLSQELQITRNVQ
ncbi:MAG: DUF5660 family protein [Patescibacteria group bacterium]